MGLTFGVVVIFFMWGAYKNLDLWDEGYLWYGVQRVMVGEVPIRDFMSYDPGRYYWSALIMLMVGDNGIVALRMSLAIFQAIGVFCGLTLISRETRKKDLLFLSISAVALVLWMTQFCKVPDYTISIIAVTLLANMIRNPNQKSFFIAGLGLGLTAVFGRNHGVYGLVGHISAIVWLSIGPTGQAIKKNVILVWIAGIVLGFMPVLLMALFWPKYAENFWDSILPLFLFKTTNFTLPVPWPWKINYSHFALTEQIYSLMLGLMFIALLLFSTLTICWAIWKKFKGVGHLLSPTFVATSLLSIPYAHYAFSRAEAYHLGMGIYPLLIGSLALFASQPEKIKWPVTIFLVVAFLWVPLNSHNGWVSRNPNWVEFEISGDKLLIPPAVAALITTTKTLINKLAPDGKNFLVVPYWPGIYAAFNKKSPTFDSYPLGFRTTKFENAEIEQLKTANVGFVLICEYPLDDLPELRFSNTHPLTYKFVTDNFSRNPDLDYLFELYTPKPVAKLH